MRIAISSDTLEAEGGVELSTMQVSRELARRGHEIHMFHQTGGALRPQYEEFARLEQVSSLYFDQRHAVRDVSRFVPAARSFSREGGDVIWLNRFEQIFWAQTVSRWSGAALVCHLRHGPNFNRVNLLSHGVDRFIAISDYIKQLWVATGLDPDRVTVAHNAVPLANYPAGGAEERALARKQLGVDDEAYVVLYYGRLDPEKGVELLLDAWNAAKLPDNALLLVLGDAVVHTEPGYVESLRSRVPAEQSRWLPMQPDVVPALHASDVVVVPSQWQEPFGRVVIEAMGTGRPVVATRVGGIPEILDGEMSEFLVDRDDADELARKLEHLVDWRTTRPGLGVACTAWVERRFDFTRLVDKVEDLLEDAVR